MSLNKGWLIFKQPLKGITENNLKFPLIHLKELFTENNKFKSNYQPQGELKNGKCM